MDHHARVDHRPAPSSTPAPTAPASAGLSPIAPAHPAGPGHRPGTAARRRTVAGAAGRRPTRPRRPAIAGCTPAPLAQRAARTLIVGLPDITDPSDPLVKKVLDIGVGGIFLNPGNVESRAQVMRLIQGIRAQAGRPIVISIDEEPGRVSTLGDLIGSSRSARRMADEGPATDVRAYATTVATELARLGIDLNLAPVADLTDGPYDEIIGDRSFSVDPAIASEYAVAYSQGMADGGVRAVAKHFPGQGRSTDDIHFEAAEPITVPLDAPAPHRRPPVPRPGPGRHPGGDDEPHPLHRPRPQPARQPVAQGLLAPARPRLPGGGHHRLAGHGRGQPHVGLLRRRPHGHRRRRRRPARAPTGSSPRRCATGWWTPSPPAGCRSAG